MAAPTDRNPIDSARTALAQIRSELVTALYNADQKTKELDQAKRLYAPGSGELTAAEAAKQAADATLLDLQTRELASRADLTEALRTWLTATAEEEIARLESSIPIVFFPARLETKFDLTTQPKTLKIRVYPDAISLNTHETALTDEEYQAAVNYYTRLTADEDEKGLWQEVVARFGSPRAAYILREMLPTLPHSAPWLSCGNDVIGTIHDNLVFPSDILRRPGNWTRPGEAVLPDRWNFVLYRGTTKRKLQGQAIPEPLAMTLDPNLPSSQLANVSNRGFQIDDNLRWTVDYDKAVSCGMAYTVTLSDQEAREGFDRLIVYGVKSSLLPVPTSDLVERVLNGHHYTRGLAIASQGSPTNNTETRRTAYPVKDDAGTVSFPIERDPPPLQRHNSHHCPPFDDDGTALTVLLGCPNGVARRIEGGEGQEQKRAQAMNRALWGSTLGYYMEQMMAKVFSRTDIAKARYYFETFVRARGPAPAFRVGQVPYGVLPVMSLKLWEKRPFNPDSQDDFEAKFVKELRLLLSDWKKATKQVDRITPNSKDPLAVQALVQAVTPSSREFRMRNAQGELGIYLSYSLLQWPYEAERQKVDQAAADLFRRLGHASWNARMGHIALDKSANLVNLPVVISDPQATSLPSPNYIQTIRDASVDQLKPLIGEDAPSLLHCLLVQSALYNYAWWTNDAILTNNSADQWRETVAVGADPLDLQNMWKRFQRVISSVSTDPLGTWAKTQATSFLEALTLLSQVEVPELERLTSETIDIASHRIDAWITALATRRLLATRSQQTTQYMKPVGSYLGGYAWLEDLRPATRTYRNQPGLGQVEIPVDNGGFIHAPSLAHAATAGVMRNAYLSHRREDPKKFAIDLSSKKARLGRELITEMLGGQSLGAVLGYRFERGLRENHPTPNPQEQNRWKVALRKLYPLVAKKTGAPADTAEPTEAIAAENVVDGNLLLKARRDNRIPWGTQGLPGNSTDGQRVITAEIDALVSLVDAVSDLMLSESVHHLLQRNVDRSLAASRAPDRGDRPVDPRVAISPRSGAGVTHRVVLVLPELGSGTIPQPPGWSESDIPLTPRALAEPALDAWVGAILGNPAQVQATATCSLGSATITLKALNLRPLDLLALAEPELRAQEGALVDARIVHAAFGDAPEAQTAHVDHTADPSGEFRTFPEILEVARAASAVLATSKALWLDDLLSPAESDVAKETYATELQAAADDAVARASAGRQRLAAVVSSLAEILDEITTGLPTAAQVSALTAVLRGQAAPFLPGSAFARSGLDGAALVTMARSVSDQLKRRDEVARSINTSVGSHRDRFLAAVTKLQAVLGSGFTVTAQVTPPQSNELAKALGARSELLGGEEQELSRFLTRIARVRDRLGNWRQLELYADVLGGTPPRQDVIQLPHTPGARWLGRTLDAGQQPKRGQLSLVLLTPGTAAPDPTAHWRGLVIDDWVELIASASEETGVALNYDSPTSEAPNCVLVATSARVKSLTTPTWDEEQLLSTLEETLELAKVRAVDGTMHTFKQLLPATLLARNSESRTIGINIVESLIKATEEAFQALKPRT